MDMCRGGIRLPGGGKYHRRFIDVVKEDTYEVGVTEDARDRMRWSLINCKKIVSYLLAFFLSFSSVFV